MDNSSRNFNMRIDGETDSMLDDLCIHYLRNQSDTVRWLIREEYRRIFGNGDQPQPVQEQQA